MGYEDFGLNRPGWGPRIALALVGTILLAYLVSCARPVPPPTPPQPPPAPNLIDISVVVRDTHGRPVVGATCQDGDRHVTTNADGFAETGPWPEGAREVACSAPRYTSPGPVVYRVVWPQPQIVAVTLASLDVDPSSIPLNELAAIRGAMWPQTVGACGNLVIGPRPGDSTNIIATVFLANYAPSEQECIVHELHDVRGYTHAVAGPLVDSDGYHGIWQPNDWRGANFERFLDMLQTLWNGGLSPVVFIKPDGWTLERAKAELTPLLQQPRAQRLIRIAVPNGWEPHRYTDSSCTWAAYGQWIRETLPQALVLGHTESDQDAPAGTDETCNDDDRHWNPGGNAAAWGRVSPFYHGWLFQFGAFDAPEAIGCDGRAPQKTHFECFQDSFRVDYPGSYRNRFERGYAGWPGSSAWGDRPLYTYAGEFRSYWTFWGRRTEAEGVAWGDAAVRAGAYGSLDGISIPVPVRP